MKQKSRFRLLPLLGLMGGLVFSDLRAEVTLDQVREEVQRQLEAQESAKQKEPPPSIDQSKIDFKSGTGIPLVRSPNGELKMNLYILVRYLNQLPASQSFEDHLGTSHDIDTANYVSAPHRVLLSFSG